MTNPSTKVRVRILKNTSGTAMVEFMVIVAPLLLSFFCFFQIALLAGARMAVQHAASSAVRMAAVSIGRQPFQSGDATTLSTHAAELALGNWATTAIARPTVTLAMGGHVDQDAEVTATVVAVYHCNVALARLIVCNGGHVEITEKSSMATQEALYR